MTPEMLKEYAERYRSNMGCGPDEELNHQWADKPHRHVFDLCRKLEEAANIITTPVARVQRLAIDNAILHMKETQSNEKQFKYWFNILVDWWENPERMIAAGEGSE